LPKVLGVVPARGGSMRIPRKNLKNFCGKPILAYSIEAMISANIFDDVMVSTEDEEIANLAVQYGASVPFFRPSELADATTGLAAVLLDVISTYRQTGKDIGTVCCVLPTAPLITVEDLQNSWQIISKKTSYDAVISITRFSYPIQRALELNEEGILRMIDDRFYRCRTQDLEPRYHDAGQLYWIKADVLRRERTLFPKRSYGYVLPEFMVQDIDTDEDWKLAEHKYKSLHKL
jgi:pseudaminic acid cytidylyltransferase